jgi:hypothetical protein
MHRIAPLPEPLFDTDNGFIYQCWRLIDSKAYRLR